MRGKGKALLKGFLRVSILNKNGIWMDRERMALNKGNKWYEIDGWLIQ